MEFLTKWTIKQWLGILILAAVLVFWPGLFGDWLDWDDVNYVLRNPFIAGANGFDLVGIFSSQHIQGQYIPLTFSFYGLLHYLFGQDPFGYHLFSLLLHALNACLVFLLVAKWSNDKVLSGFIGLLFVLSPMHVEAVAWIASLKDVLSTAFALSALLMFIKWVEAKEDTGGSRHFYWLSLVLFILALMSKGTVILLPFVMLFILMDAREWRIESALIGLFPFILSALIFGYLHWRAQDLGGALSPMGDFDLIRDAIIAGRNLGHYLLHAFIPYKLSPFHPYPIGIDTEFDVAFLALSGLGLFSSLGLIYLGIRRKEYRWPLVLYFTLLLPVIQFLPFGPAIAAERFTYLAFIGLWMIAGHALFSLIKKVYQSRVLLGLLTYLFILTIINFNYIHSWKSTQYFWQSTLSSYPEDPFTLANLGNEAAKSGNVDIAIEYYDEAIQRDGRLIEAINNRGLIYWEMGRDSLAIIDFQKVIMLDPTFVSAIINSGLIWMNNDFNTLAMNAFNKAIQMDNTNPIAFYNRGILFDRLGLYRKAIQDLTSSIDLVPNEAEFYRKRSMLYLQNNEAGNAIPDLRNVLKYDRDDRRSAFLLDSLISSEALSN